MIQIIIRELLQNAKIKIIGIELIVLEVEIA